MHVIVDALFPNAESIAFASSRDIAVTWSQNTAHKSKLFSVLSDGLPQKRWRLACQPDEEGLMDRHYFVYHDSKVMMGGSTAFQPPGSGNTIWGTGCTPSLARDLYRLEKSTLSWLITQLPNTSLQRCGSTEAAMISHITSIPPEHWAKKHPWIGRKVEVVPRVTVLVVMII